MYYRKFVKFDIFQLSLECLEDEYRCDDGFCLDFNATGDRQPDCIDQNSSRTYIERQRLCTRHPELPFEKSQCEYRSDYAIQQLVPSKEPKITFF